MPALAAINHLLAQEAWARAALARHAGKEARIDTGVLELRMHVAADGMLEASRNEDGGPAGVTIRVKLADLPLIAQDRSRALSYVKIEGDAEFANTISQLANGLRWDAEHDLERAIGPIGARRVAENLAEFLAEERPVLVRPAQREEFAAEVVRLRDDVERTAKRIARLEQRLAQQDTTSAARAITALSPDRR